MNLLHKVLITLMASVVLAWFTPPGTGSTDLLDLMEDVPDTEESLDEGLLPGRSFSSSMFVFVHIASQCELKYASKQSIHHPVQIHQSCQDPPCIMMHNTLRHTTVHYKSTITTSLAHPTQQLC